METICTADTAAQCRRRHQHSRIIHRPKSLRPRAFPAQASSPTVAHCSSTSGPPTTRTRATTKQRAVPKPTPSMAPYNISLSPFENRQSNDFHDSTSKWRLLLDDISISFTDFHPTYTHILFSSIGPHTYTRIVFHSQGTVGRTESSTDANWRWRWPAGEAKRKRKRDTRKSSPG